MSPSTKLRPSGPAASRAPMPPADPTQVYFQSLLARLRMQCGPDSPSQVLGLTSSTSGEGVSTIVTGLAAAAADLADLRVLVLDANFKRPALHARLDCAPKPGLAELLSDEAELDDVLQPLNRDGVCFISAGKANASSLAALGSPRIAELLETLRLKFNLIVIDLPPAEPLSLWLPTARLMDGLVLVVEANRVQWPVAQQTLDLLRGVEGNLAGVVLNKCR